MNVQIENEHLELWASLTKLLLQHADAMAIARVQTTDNCLLITTANPSSRLSLAVPAKVDVAGKVYTSIARLNAFAQNVTDGPVRIEHRAANSLRIYTESTEVNLPLAEEDAVPPQYGLNVDTVISTILDTASFRAALELTETFAQKDKAFAADWEGSFYIEIMPNGGFVVTSDRRQLASVSFKAEGGVMKMTIPKGFLLQVMRIANEKVQLFWDGQIARFSCNNFQADFQLLEKNMPAIRQDMLRNMTESTLVAKLPTEQLARTLTLVNAVARGNAKYYAYLDIYQDGVKLRVNGDRVDEVASLLNGSANGQIRYFIDHERLLAALTHFQKCGLKSSEVLVQFSDNTNPIYINIGGPEDFYSLSALAPPEHQNK